MGRHAINNQTLPLMQKHPAYIRLIVAMTTAGCSIHQPPKQQGNVLDKEAVAQLKPGLSIRQVNFILGDPVLANPFRPERWDYVYWLKPKSEKPTLKRISIYFDNDTVSRQDDKSVELPADTAPVEGQN